MRRFSLLLVVFLLAGCEAGGPAPETDEAPDSPSLPNDVHWVRNSAEYRAAFLQTYRLAALRLAERVAEREPGSWAVALDADETVISNSQYEKELALAGKEHSQEQWDAWVARQQAAPLPGAPEFLALVHELGGRIAIVTNRLERNCPATEANFRSYAIPFDVVLCRQESREKEPRWKAVGNGTAAPGLPPLEIVMWLGDNIEDFPGLDQSIWAGPEDAFADFGEKYFVLPNPMYGSWADNPPQ